MKEIQKQIDDLKNEMASDLVYIQQIAEEPLDYLQAVSDFKEKDARLKALEKEMRIEKELNEIDSNNQMSE